MKKLVLSMFAAATLVACGGSGPASDAKEVCDCSKKLNEMKMDDPKRMEEAEKCSKLSIDNMSKYKDDRDKYLEYSEALVDCSGN
jgi:hypothetical protein